METLIGIEDSSVDFLHEIGGRLTTTEGFHAVLDRVVEFASALVKCDSCLIYVLEGEDLVLRASKNAHPDVVDRLKLRVGQGITGWVAQHHEPVAIAEKAAQDPRFQFFHELPEDSYEAFLSVPLMCRGRLVGAINLQHRRPHTHKPREIRLISAIGVLVGAEIELARMEEMNSHLTDQLQTRKVVERAKGIFMRRLNLDEPEAHKRLQQESQKRRIPMAELAKRIIESEEMLGGGPPS